MVMPTRIEVRLPHPDSRAGVQDVTEAFAFPEMEQPDEGTASSSFVWTVRLTPSTERDVWLTASLSGLERWEARHGLSQEDDL